MTSHVENSIFPPEPPLLDENKISIGLGEFEYIESTHIREMLKNAWQAISLTENWQFMAKPVESYMTSQDERTKQIYKKMEQLGYYGHSGGSFGLVMREMQFIAKHGEKKFKDKSNF